MRGFFYILLVFPLLALGKDSFEKSMDIAESPELNILCPTFSDGIYVLLQPVLLANAAAACLEFGLGLANLTFSNNFVASQILSQCGSSVGWLSSFERVRSNTCVVLTGNGNVFYPDNTSCQSAVNVAVCQDFANTVVTTATTTFTFCSQSTVTLTSVTGNTVTTTVVSTFTSTASGDPDSTGCGGFGCVETKTATLTPPVSTVIVTVTDGFTTVGLKALEHGGELVPIVSENIELRLSTVVSPVTVTFRPPIPVANCPHNMPACGANIGVGEFVLLKSYVPFSQAACACKSIDMQLADIAPENFNDATNALFRCGGAFGSAWIHSYHGNTHGGLCLALSTGPSAPGGTVGYPGSCDSGLPILCQRRPTSWNSNNFKPNNAAAQDEGGVVFPFKKQPIAYEKNIPLAPKKQKSPNHLFELQDPIYSLCPTTQNNLYIVSSQAYLPNQNYAAACAAFELVPANINSSNRGAAGVVFGICSSGDQSAVAAILNSFEAIQGSTCDLVDDVGAVVVVNSNSGDIANNCATNRYFLCQATNLPPVNPSTIFTGPFVFVTTTTVATTAISTINTSRTITLSQTITTTTTEVEFVSLTVTTQVSTSTTTVQVTSGQVVTVTATNVSTVTPVVPTCPGVLFDRAPENKGFIVLKDKAPYWEAECACKAYGLKLAELSVDNFNDASESIYKALGSAQKAWIKKYQMQAFGSQCMALYTKNSGEKSGGGGSVLPMYCDVPIPVICQEA